MALIIATFIEQVSLLWSVNHSFLKIVVLLLLVIFKGNQMRGIRRVYLHAMILLNIYNNSKLSVIIVTGKNSFIVFFYTPSRRGKKL